MNEADLQKRILELKNEREAIVLAHNYTDGAVQDIADFVGDSLELSRKAAECDARVIVFCGVRFMAETAKILSPESIVIHPTPSAGCPMADMASPEMLERYRAAHPGVLIVAYVNTTAATKTAVDICCTSGNAEKLIASLPRDREILFVPDCNLGRNVAAATGREMTFWPGYCPIHNAMTPSMMLDAKARYPQAKAIVHPECKPEVVAVADAALSTSGMLSYVKNCGAKEFIIGTESGIIHRMKKENPTCVFHTILPEPICANMKKITLADVAASLETLSPCVELSAETIDKARTPIERMLAVK